MAMATVMGNEVVVVGQAGDDTDADRLLAGVKVDEAGDVPLGEERRDPLLEGANRRILS